MSRHYASNMNDYHNDYHNNYHNGNNNNSNNNNNNNSNNDNNDAIHSNDEMYMGEITAETIDNSDIFDKGMPIRSNFTVKRSRYDNNSHLDFDLYEKKGNDGTFEVSHNDTCSGE